MALMPRLPDEATSPVGPISVHIRWGRFQRPTVRPVLGSPSVSRGLGMGNGCKHGATARVNRAPIALRVTAHSIRPMRVPANGSLTIRRIDQNVTWVGQTSYVLPYARTGAAFTIQWGYTMSNGTLSYIPPSLATPGRASSCKYGRQIIGGTNDARADRLCRWRSLPKFQFPPWMCSPSVYPNSGFLGSTRYGRRNDSLTIGNGANCIDCLGWHCVCENDPLRRKSSRP